MHQSTRRHIAIGGGILFLFSVSAASAVDDKEVIKQARGRTTAWRLTILSALVAT